MLTYLELSASLVSASTLSLDLFIVETLHLLDPRLLLNRSDVSRDCKVNPAR